MTRVAIVSYFAPPQAAIAAHRVLRLSRCLLKAGHAVEWVTLDGARAERFDGTIPIPDRVVVHPLGGSTVYGRRAARNLPEKVLRSLAHELPRRWAFIDGHFEWRWRLRRQLPRLAAERGWDAVLFCCGPHGQITAVPRLRRALPDLAIYVDYRDLLSGNPWNAPEDSRLGARLLARERRLLAAADALFVNSVEARERFLEVVGTPGDLKVEVMRNAADYGLADEIFGAAPPADLGPGAHLGFFGTMFEKRRLRVVLDAMAVLPPERLARLTLHCFCDLYQSKPLLDEDCRAAGPAVAARVHHHKYVPYADALRTMRAMHALVLINSSDPEDAVFVPGKLFDYMMARRPVLFVGASGDAARLVDEVSGPGWTFGYGDREELSRRLDALADATGPVDLEPRAEYAPERAFAPLLERLTELPSRIPARD